MKNSKNLFENIKAYFSHIYVEKEALDHTLTKQLLQKIEGSVILIDFYKEVFNRPRQDFSLQKQTPNLILAVKKDNFIYEGSPMCNDFDNKEFFYTSSIMNCLFDCEYCYLQGLYPSGNIVIFVNIEDTFAALKNLLPDRENIYLCPSYDTDLLAFENISHFSEKWIDFALENKSVQIELRTKSSNFHLIAHKKPTNNVILAWTLTPQVFIDKFEKKTPSLSRRLDSVTKALADGWRVRLCFDPIIYENNFENIYHDFFDYVFNYHKLIKNVESVSFGLFRLSKDALKTMKKNNPTSLLINYPFYLDERGYTYHPEEQELIIETIFKSLDINLPQEKIFFF